MENGGVLFATIEVALKSPIIREPQAPRLRGKKLLANSNVSGKVLTNALGIVFAL
jgi:hypothetical protein